MIWRNSPILNCGRCLTKIWMQRVKEKRRTTKQKTITRMRKKTRMRRSWTTRCWCQIQTESGSAFTNDFTENAATPRVSRRWRRTSWYKKQLLSALPWRLLGAQWLHTGCEGIYIHSLLHKYASYVGLNIKSFTQSEEMLSTLMLWETVKKKTKPTEMCKQQSHILQTDIPQCVGWKQEQMTSLKIWIT